MSNDPRPNPPHAQTPAEPSSAHADPATADLLRQTAETAASWLAGVGERPVRESATRAQLLAGFGAPLADQPTAADEVVAQLVAAAEPGLIGMPGPRYFGFVIGGSLPAALAADWLTATWDQNAGIYAAGPAASVVEEVVGAWLLDLFGLPEDTGFGFTTGCQMAHFTCLAAARHEVLRRAGHNVEEDGLADAPRITVIVSAEVHATLPTALQYLGIGRGRLVKVETDRQGRIELQSLAECLEKAEGPLIVALQAGNVNTGAFDPIADAIPMIRRRRPNAWIHVDGAFGLWAAASPRLRHLVAGLGLADSWATDGHKALNVPYDSGIAFVRNRDAHTAALSPQAAAYIAYGDVERDEFRWVPEYSRRARGFAAWAALRQLGRNGVAEMMDRQVALAQRLAAGVRAAWGVARAQVLNDVVFNQVLLRFPTASGSDADGDERTRAVVRAVQADGTAWMSGSQWHGLTVMRASVSNWSTTEADIDRTVEAIVRAARSVA